MPCNSPRLDLLSYIHGELDATQSAEIELHLAECPLCADEIAHLRMEVDRLFRLMAVPAPDGLAGAALSRIENEARRGPGRTRFAVPLFPPQFRPLRAFALSTASVVLAVIGLSIISPPAYAMVVSGVARIGAQVTDLASQHIPAYDTFVRILAGLKAAAGF